MTTLAVPQYYSQVDSATGMGYRMCFSSSCAMGLKFLLPDALKGPNADDDYLHRVLMYGDTTESAPARSRMSMVSESAARATMVRSGRSVRPVMVM
jgi:hypothetical protein